MATLHTARLQLRAIEAGDAAWLHGHWNKPEVRRFLFDDQPVEAEQVAKLIDASAASFAQRGFGAWLLLGGEAVGVCALFEGFTDPAELEIPGPYVELLVSLEPSAWGQGLATEASAAVLEFGHTALGLVEIGGGHDRDNVASMRMLQRLGFRPFRTIPGILGPIDHYLHIDNA